MTASLFANTTLSEEGMRSLVRLRGELPREHRLTAWKYLLQLPGNASTFYGLLQKGPHPAAVASLATRYPMRDRKLFRKTAVLISALAHWSPIVAEVEFVPGWVFPFVVVFQQDDLGAFEAAMSFLLHWGARLLVTFPQPPVPVLAGMELALRRIDRELATHLKALLVGALSYGWPLLRSAFSEVLAAPDWLRLIDHVLANAGRPEMLEAAAVAFAVASRARLLACRSTSEAEAVFRTRCGSIDLEKMLRVMERVSKFGVPGGRSREPVGGGGSSNPRWNHRGRPAGRARGQVGGGGGGEDGEGGARAALALLRSAPREFQALPMGAYPCFDGYPQFAVNYQMELRERVVKLEEEAERKNQLVQELEQRAQSIATREIAMEEQEKEGEEDGEERKSYASELEHHRWPKPQTTSRDSASRLTPTTMA